MMFSSFVMEARIKRATSRQCTVIILGLVVLAAGCGDRAPGAPSPARPASITAITPTRMSGLVGTATTDEPAVVVKDLASHPVPNVTVQFIVISGLSGRIEYPSATTDEHGIARAGAWVLPIRAGESRLSARVDGTPLTVAFTAVANPDRPVRLATGNSVLIGFAGELVDSIVVTAVDVYGNALDGVAVTFTVTSGDGLLGGDVKQVTVMTAGSRAWTRWRLRVGANEVRANSPGLNTATFSARGVDPAGMTWYALIAFRFGGKDWNSSAQGVDDVIGLEGLDPCLCSRHTDLLRYEQLFAPYWGARSGFGLYAADGPLLLLQNDLWQGQDVSVSLSNDEMTMRRRDWEDGWGDITWVFRRIPAGAPGARRVASTRTLRVPGVGRSVRSADRAAPGGTSGP